MVVEEGWLIRIFQPEKLKNFSLAIYQREETYFRLMYAAVTGKKEDSTEKTFHCFFKYHMSVISSLAQTAIPKEYFTSERYWYDIIYPTFVEFQKAKGVHTPFNNVPKCYGTLLDDDSLVLIQRVIVLENVKATGHVLWSSRRPLSRKHLQIVLEAYAKLHATFAAMKKHDFTSYNDMSRAVWQLQNQRMKALKAEEKCVEDQPALAELFMDSDFNGRLPQGPPPMAVILHGDCWTNNFLSRFEDLDSKTVPQDLVIVDWQMVNYGPLIHDVSSFLISFISDEDIPHLVFLLEFYYEKFCAHLKEMGIPDADVFYSYQHFKDDWKQCCKYGFIASYTALVTANLGGGATNHLCYDAATFLQKMRQILDYLRHNDLMPV